MPFPLFGGESQGEEGRETCPWRAVEEAVKSHCSSRCGRVSGRRTEFAKRFEVSTFRSAATEDGRQFSGAFHPLGECGVGL